MGQWWEVAIRYQKEDEAGALKTINEHYLFDSISHTEAEALAFKRIVTGASDFSVNTIKRMRLADLFAYDEGDQWFKVKVIYFSVDDRSGKEKKVVNYMLVNSDGIQQALDRMVESLRTMLIPYEITNIDLTKILDVIPYESDEETPVIPDNMRPLADVLADRAKQIGTLSGPDGTAVAGPDGFLVSTGTGQPKAWVGMSQDQANKKAKEIDGVVDIGIGSTITTGVIPISYDGNNLPDFISLTDPSDLDK